MKTLCCLVTVIFFLTLGGCHGEKDLNVSKTYENSQTENRMPPSLILSNENLKDNVQQKASLQSKNNLNYVGCWVGMRGGKLKITSTQIFDLITKESANFHTFSYEEINKREEFLLEANNDFQKSFLSKFLKIIFNDDGTSGFISYESHEDYLANKFVGQGLFEKVPCEDLK